MIPLNPISYFPFFGYYFSSEVALAVLAIGFGSIASLFLVFKSSRKSEVRSRTLISMLAISASLWVFVLASIAFCVMLLPMYWSAPDDTVSIVAKLALSFSLLVAPLGVFFLRGRAAKEASGIFFPRRKAGESLTTSVVSSEADRTNSDEQKGRVLAIFSSLDKYVFPSRVEVEVLPTAMEKDAPFSGALDWHGKKIVAITENVAGSLDDDELQAVLAHELAHIKYRDALLKTIATAYRLAFQYDPLSRLIEAAIYREREFAADEFAARFTEKPAALASALLKVYGLGQLGRSFEIPILSSLSLPRSTASVLSKQPSLKLRIERLLKMSELRSSSTFEDAIGNTGVSPRPNSILLE